MAVTRIKNSGIKTGTLKYDSALGGYPPVMAAPTATAGASSASVAFTAVTGATSYTALSNPGSITGTGTSSPITVSGLTNGTAYTFQIRAENSTGNGAYSAASNSVTPVVPGKFESIASLQGDGSATVLTFNNINSLSASYHTLQIRTRWAYTSGGSANSVQAIIYFNGDTTASNYYTHYITGYASSGQTSSTGGINGIYLNQCVPNTPIDYARFGTAVIDINGFNDTSKRTVIRALHGAELGVSNSDAQIGFTGGIWNSLNNVSSISLTMTAGRVWTSSTRIDLYGIKG